MSRALAVTLLLLSGCGKPSSDAPPPDPSVPASAPPLTRSSAEVPASSTAPILTPEDVEAETEHRITEQNLESELDRLEREIQAE